MQGDNERRKRTMETTRREEENDYTRSQPMNRKSSMQAK